MKLFRGLRRATIFSVLSLLNVYVLSAQMVIDESVRKILSTINIVNQKYVDTLDRNRLATETIKSLIGQLDPHSSYLSASELQELNEPLDGKFSGIGISFQIVRDTIYVVDVIVEGPSSKVGLRPGDKIVSVDGILVSGTKKTNKDIRTQLRGAQGSKVKIEVMRQGVNQLLSFTIRRDDIPIHSITAYYMAAPEVGYIKINHFGKETYNEFQAAISKLRKQGMKHLILDLQNNGGGYLLAANQIANEFLQKGQTIVYTEGANQPPDFVYATGRGKQKDGRVVVLINEISASASEIVSGALQDWDRAVLVGRRTFGKGLVQRLFMLPDDTAIKLTVARYHTPTGRAIQKNYTLGESERYSRELQRRYEQGELSHADSTRKPRGELFRTLTKNRPVYSEEGISPDFFVPLDTTLMPLLAQRIITEGILNRVFAKNISYKQQTLLTYPSSEAFREKYTADSFILDEIKIALKDEDIAYTPEEWDKTKNFLRQQVKAFMARELYSATLQYQILNDYNAIYKEALQIIQSPQRYEQMLLPHVYDEKSKEHGNREVVERK